MLQLTQYIIEQSSELAPYTQHGYKKVSSINHVVKILVIFDPPPPLIIKAYIIQRSVGKKQKGLVEQPPRPQLTVHVVYECPQR